MDKIDKLKVDALSLSRRITAVKIKMLGEYPFFGLLAQNVRLAIDPDCPTACTDGETIYFGQDFSTRIGDDELAFLFMHELMHIVLGHCFRSVNLIDKLYNIAADIVINSTLIDEMNLADSYIDNEPIMHLTPKNDEGYLYTAEEVYDMLLNNVNVKFLANDSDIDINAGNKPQQNGNFNKPTDDHSKWGTLGDDSLKKAIWQQRILETCSTLSNSKEAGSIPGFAKRVVDEIKRPSIDWRTILNNFIQEEINDYSFSPPDRRFADNEFFLPDFNEIDVSIKDIWIAIDASGSISDYDLALALNEVRGAIDQYNGKFKGWISFFDVKVSKPTPFDSVEDIKKITPVGGGGTSFENIFKEKNKYFKEELTCIIVITDGFAPWPKEDAAQNTPVLWLLNNKLANPPWGVVARMKKSK